MGVLWVWWCVVGVVMTSDAWGTSDVTGLSPRDPKHRYRISGDLAVHVNAAAGEPTHVDASSSVTNQPPKSQGEDVLVVTGGYSGNRIIPNDVELLRLGQGQWSTIAPRPHLYSALVVLDGKLYSVGGQMGDECSTDVYVYNITTNEWIPGPSLSECHYMHGMAVIGSTIYAIGGTSDRAEALDAGASAWRLISEMIAGCNRPHAIVINGKLYSLCDDFADGSVERYDPATNEWEKVPEMLIRHRFDYGASVLDGAVYLVGGFWDDEYSTVQRFRPSANGLGNWSTVPPMHNKRRWPAVVTYQGKLYAVGGYDGRNDLNTVEVFNPATETWTLLNATMSVVREDSSAVVLEHVTL